MVVSAKFLKARDAVRKARMALQEAERRFDRDRGTDPGATARLIADIKAAEAVLAGADAAAREEDAPAPAVTAEPPLAMRAPQRRFSVS
jgi:hypothetical protein